MTGFAERLRAGVAAYREERAPVWAAEAAAEQAERERQEAAEQAARVIQPSPVDAAVAEQAKEQANPLFGLLRRFQDAQAKFESVRREVDHWMLPPIQTDDDLDRAIGTRNQLESSSALLTLDGKRKLGEKLVELTAAIDAAKSRWLYAKAEPVFRTNSLFADSLFNQHRCHRVSNRNEKCFVLALDSLAASDPKTARRIVDLFTACGAGFFPGEFGPSIVLELREKIVGTNPIRLEYGAPSEPAIDGFEIVKDTRDATEWRERREAERQRKENERLEAERENARRERERKVAEFRELMAEAQQQQQPITENV